MTMTDAPKLLDIPQALPPGTRFGDLEVVRTLGVGGFGIVYLARDHALQRMVAIKEYMPGELAQRHGGSQVLLRSNEFTDTFDTGRRSFVHEARLLARFDHRSLLKVYQFWEANGTAYMVMPYLSGQNLKQVRQAMSQPPAEAWLKRVLLPLLDALDRLHAESVVHRDISPDNILLPDDGADPILLDFGAARRAIGDQTQTITAILKPRFAPIEQYGESNGLRQGPWTDLYALGAVMHFLILGRTPPQATTRTVADDYQPLARQQQRLGLPMALLEAIDWSLRVHPQDRPQTAAEMRAAVEGTRAVPAPVRASVGALPPPVSPRAKPIEYARADDPTVVVGLGEHVKTIQMSAPRKTLRQRHRAVQSRGLPLASAPHLRLAAGGAGVLAMVALVVVLWPRPVAKEAAQQPREEIIYTEPAPTAPPPATQASLGTLPAGSETRNVPPGAAPARPANSPPNQSAAADPPVGEGVQASPSKPAEPPRTQTSAPAERPAPKPARRRSPALPAPSKVCADRSVFTRWRCVQQECAKPARANHPECASSTSEERPGRRNGSRQ